MSLVLSMFVAGVPVAKGRAKARVVRTKSGGQFVSMYTPSKTRTFENLVHMAGQQAMAGRPPLVGVPLHLTITFWQPALASFTKKQLAEMKDGVLWNFKRPDLDNLVKAVTDGLNGVAYADDGAICSMNLCKKYGERSGASVMLESLVPFAVQDPLIEVKEPAVPF